MYKLSEQPVARIIDEMVNFSPLYHRVAVCKVKEPFSIDDINYEEGDLVALTGDSESKIEIECYQNLKERHSYVIRYGVSGERLSITVDDFKKRFELCEEETIKVEKMIAQAKNIYSEQYSEILQKRAEPLDDYGFVAIGLMLILGLAFVIYLFLPGRDDRDKLSLIILILSTILVLSFFLFNFIKDMKHRVIERKYLDKYNEMDKQREQSGMYIPESEK